MRKSACLLFALAPTACGMTDASDYDNLTGRFTGTTRGSPGDLLAPTTIEVTAQDEGDLNGTWGLTGLLHGSVPISLDGTFEGTVEKGRDPVVSFSLDDGCGRRVDLSGEYDTVRQRLALSGDVYLAPTGCESLVPLALQVEVVKQSGS